RWARARPIPAPRRPSVTRELRAAGEPWAADRCAERRAARSAPARAARVEGERALYISERRVARRSISWLSARPGLGQCQAGQRHGQEPERAPGDVAVLQQAAQQVQPEQPGPERYQRAGEQRQRGARQLLGGPQLEEQRAR